MTTLFPPHTTVTDRRLLKKGFDVLRGLILPRRELVELELGRVTPVTVGSQHNVSRTKMWLWIAATGLSLGWLGAAMVGWVPLIEAKVLLSLPIEILLPWTVAGCLLAANLARLRMNGYSYEQQKVRYALEDLLGSDRIVSMREPAE